MILYPWHPSAGICASRLSDTHVKEQVRRATSVLTASLVYHLNRDDPALLAHAFVDTREDPWVLWASGDLRNLRWMQQYATALAWEYRWRWGLDCEHYLEPVVAAARTRLQELFREETLRDPKFREESLGGPQEFIRVFDAQDEDLLDTERYPDVHGVYRRYLARVYRDRRVHRWTEHVGATWPNFYPRRML